jgi:hypothetical protein
MADMEKGEMERGDMQRGDQAKPASTSPPSPLLEVKRGVPKPVKLVLTTNSKYSVLTNPVSSN